MKFLRWYVMGLIVQTIYCSVSYAATSSDFAATPPNLTDTTDPFVMINLSVELTQQAEAYTDGKQTLVGGTYCPGHDGSGYGICYINSEQYLGYFDSEKCYVYDTSGANTGTAQLATGPTGSADPYYFRPVGYATNRQCSGSQFSGNFMNWATMTALDEFRYAMTGGARLVDTSGASAKTLLTRTHRYGDWGFRRKRIRSSGISGFATSPSTVTPFSISQLRIRNDNGNVGNKVEFYDSSNNLLATYNVIVEVCNPNVGLEANCVKYTDGTNTWYKPEGAIQNHSLQMRFALTSYTGDDDHRRNGGVLRANAKYVGYYRPATGGGLELNPNAEVGADGVFVFNPDNVTIGSGVNNSGIINYINSFALGPERYKSYDPVAELFYEGLRYFKNLGPTPEYSQAYGSLPALTNDQKDNFPIITIWDDPIVDACQANYMIAIGDQFSWEDHNLPGMSSTIYNGPSFGQRGVPATPSNPDTDIDAMALTDKVGVLENYGAGGSVTSLGDETRGRNNNGWWFAGLAYYANTQDIRTGAGANEVGIQTVKTFVVDTQEYNSSPPMKQDNPLWLAAKYGGFDDANGDGDPGNGVAGATTDEWDADGDGDPDTYTLASQPANLVAGLNNAFSEISERISAGSAASVVTNTSSAEGVVYQGLYKPKLTVKNDQIKWLGILRSLFIDKYGNFREDTDGDATLTNADKIVEFRYDPIREKSVADRYVTTDGGATKTIDSTDIDIEDLDALWNARDQLASVSDVVSQRNYSLLSATANNARYIFTAIDSDNDGLVTDADVIPFTAANFPAASSGTSDNFRYLGLDSATGDEAPNIVNYIRGEEVSGYRSRTIDYDGDGADEVWRLGDIINSSPIAVGRPDQRYDLQYGDETYRDFLQQYFYRRQVVYVGANDGILHAFNAGFYDASANQFMTTPSGGASVVAHPLGSELWGYVPYNLLPHLRWLTEPDYPHVYYVDGIPQVFEVNIFPDDATHPNGWGTILVVGLRFGGGDITFDPDSNTDADLTDDVTTRSSFIILDITDPEQPPTLVAEISHPEMGYTTSRPTLIKKRLPNSSDGSYTNPAANKWYLVFGSGPAGSNATNKATALSDAVSDQQARLYVFDLTTKSFVQNSGNDYFLVTGANNGFAGDLTAADWDRDFVDDVVYFGTVQGTVSSPDGEMMRFIPGMTNLSYGTSTFNKLITAPSGVNKPFTGPPHVSTNTRGTHWVHFGSGRFFVPDDSLSSSQQSYYGVKEPVDASGNLTYASINVNSDLVDTTDIEVFANGGIRRSGNSPFTLSNGDSVGTFTQLQSSIRSSSSGWYFDFSNIRARNVGLSGQIGASILFTEYVPSGISCDPSGNTYLNAVHFETGTAAPFAALGAGTTVFNSANISERSVGFGIGLVRDIVVNEKQKSVIGQGDDGALVQEAPKVEGLSGSRMSWREIDID